MNDSVDIKTAQQKLQKALKSLEGSLTPLLSRIDSLEAQASEAGAFSEDRSRLASELDLAQANLSEAQTKFKAREQEFESLADETTKELDRVIKQVRAALGQDE